MIRPKIKIPINAITDGGGEKFCSPDEITRSPNPRDSRTFNWLFERVDCDEMIPAVRVIENGDGTYDLVDGFHRLAVYEYVMSLKEELKDLFTERAPSGFFHMPYDLVWKLYVAKEVV